MKLSAYLKDRFLLLLLHIVCMGIVSGFLRITGYNEANIILILLFSASIIFLASNTSSGVETNDKAKKSPLFLHA